MYGLLDNYLFFFNILYYFISVFFFTINYILLIVHIPVPAKNDVVRSDKSTFS